MKCIQPELGRQLFESSSLQELAKHPHVSHCPACQEEHQQLVRMHDYWDREPLSQAELLRLEMRCRPRPLARQRPRRTRRVVWASFGGVIALGTAAAAATGYLDVGIAPFGQQDPSAEQREPSGHSALERRASERKASSTAPQAAASPSPEAPSDGEKERADEDGSATEKAPAEPTRTQAPSPRPRRKSKPSTGTRDPGWIEAAEALKNDDQQAAEEALQQLSHSEDAVTRDAAKLTLAETYLDQGKRARAEPILRRLATSGATATIRARARKLLQ